MSKLTHDLVECLKEFVVDERRILFEEKIQQRTKHMTVVLENIFQGRNISASIRSADCFGVQDVHVIENDNIRIIFIHVLLKRNYCLILMAVYYFLC